VHTTLATRSSPEPTGKAPVEVGLRARALLLQADGNIRAREAVARSVMDQRW